jgi:hypothetical protein
VRIFEDNVNFPLLPAYVDDLQTKITDAVKEVTPDMLCHAWEGI